MAVGALFLVAAVGGFVVALASVAEVFLAVTAEQEEVLNQSWPPAEVARALNNVREPIAVSARVVFERDGETWLDAMAVRWWRRHVCVHVEGEERLQVPYVWVDAGEVRRR